MRRRAVGRIWCLLLAACLPGVAVADEPAPPPRKVPAAGGPRLTVIGPAELRFGHHLDVKLTCDKDTDTPPHVRFVWTGLGRTVRLELRTENGEVVPTVGEDAVWGGSLRQTFGSARLRPTGPHARGVCLAPGRYTLRAAVEARKNPFDPIAWAGRVEAAPVAFTVPDDGAGPLTADAVRRLVADLTAADPGVRLAAVRRVPPTDDADVLAALVGRLADPHQAQVLAAVCLPPTTRPVADAARRDALPAQGSAAIGPALAFAARPESAPHRGAVAELLGRLGPDPRSLAFLRGLLAGGTQDDRYYAVRALGRLGPDAVPDLVRVARDEKQHPYTRRDAIGEMAHHGTAESAGPFLREMLGTENWEYVSAAARTAEAVGDRAALPDLKRVAEDTRYERHEQNARTDALRAYAVVADRRDARELVLKQLDAKTAFVRGHAVYLLAGVGGPDDVPRIVEMLSDPEWYVRAQADVALRGLADKPEGVGYDAVRPATADVWRAWWRTRR